MLVCYVPTAFVLCPYNKLDRSSRRSQPGSASANPNTNPRISLGNRPDLGATTFSFLSQPAVTSMPPFISMYSQHLIGASCAATCCAWPVLTSYIRAALSQPEEKRFCPDLRIPSDQRLMKQEGDQED